MHQCAALQQMSLALVQRKCTLILHFSSSNPEVTCVPNLDQVPPTFSTWMTDIPFLKMSHLCLWNICTEPWIYNEKGDRRG